MRAEGFIDENDLLGDPVTEGNWDESSQMPERLIKLLVDGGVSWFTTTEEGKRALRRALPFREQRERQKIETLALQYPLTVVHGYARRMQDLPVCAVVLRNDVQIAGDRVLGDFASPMTDHYLDAGGGRASLYTVPFEQMIDLIIYATHPDVLIFWYHVLKLILTQSARVLAVYGVDIPRYAGSDLASSEEFGGEFVYIRTFTLTVRTSIVFSESPSFVAYVNSFVQDDGGSGQVEGY